MQVVVRDTLSLRPPGFYGYTFLTARMTQIVSLAVITGITSHLISIITRSGETPSATLIGVIVLTSAGFLWALFSCTGYSRRYLPYAATWSVDLVFLIPLVAVTIILGLPLADANCAAVSRTGRFEITAPPGSSSGRIVFPTDGRAACSRLFAVWVLLIVVCASYVISALSVGFLHLGERQLRKAVFRPSGGNQGGYGQGVAESGIRGFGPTPRLQPGFARSVVSSKESLGMNDFNNSGTPSWPSIAEDRLNLNRPITIAPRYRAVGGGQVYEKPLGRPAMARMPRLRPEDAFEQPGYGRGR